MEKRTYGNDIFIIQKRNYGRLLSKKDNHITTDTSIQLKEKIIDNEQVDLLYHTTEKR